jgi:capsular polysaccharide biosynthesis protein/SAM-dependent methyltransferase
MQIYTLNRLFSSLKSNVLLSSILVKPARLLWAVQRSAFRLITRACIRIPLLNSGLRSPIAYEKKTEIYIASSPSSGRKIFTDNGGSIPRVFPVSVDKTFPQHMHPSQPVIWADREVYQLKNITVIGGYSSALVTSCGQLLGDLSPDIFGSSNHEIFGRLTLPQPTFLRGSCLLLTTPEASNNYSHWLFDLLPRLYYIQSSGLSIKSFDHYLVNSLQPNYQAETLEACGVPLDKVILIGRHQSFRCEEAVVTTMRGCHWQYSLNPMEIEWVSRHLFDPKAKLPPKSPRRIWLSRRNASFRRLLNEDLLSQLLAAYSLIPLNPDQYSVAQQAAIFQNAELVVGAHSSSMCNLMFCKPGTPVLEILSPYHHDISFWTVASLSGLKYYFLQCDTDLSVRNPIATRFIDFAVSSDSLQSALELISCTISINACLFMGNVLTLFPMMRIIHAFSFNPPLQGERFLDYIARGVGSRLSLIGELLNVSWLIYNPLHFYHFEVLAKRAAPILSDVIRQLFPTVQSVADVGCGTGEFALQLSMLGLSVESCENSPYGQRLARAKGLKCHSFDLTQQPPSFLQGSFDAVICFEVAEHISPSLSKKLVDYCCSLSDFIIFTASPPGQGGTGHINEAPYDFWIDLFKLFSMQYSEDLTKIYRAALCNRLGDESPWLWRNALLFERIR